MDIIYNRSLRIYRSCPTEPSISCATDPLAVLGILRSEQGHPEWWSQEPVEFKVNPPVLLWLHAVCTDWHVTAKGRGSQWLDGRSSRQVGK